MNGKPDTAQEKLARLIIAHQIMAEDASCSAGAAGYKSADNPDGDCPIKHKAINTEMYFLINEYEASYGEWTTELMEKAWDNYIDQRKTERGY